MKSETAARQPSSRARAREENLLSGSAGVQHLAAVIITWPRFKGHPREVCVDASRVGVDWIVARGRGELLLVPCYCVAVRWEGRGWRQEWLYMRGRCCIFRGVKCGG